MVISPPVKEGNTKMAGPRAINSTAKHPFHIVAGWEYTFLKKSFIRSISPYH
jgi:hypothetical protein